MCTGISNAFWCDRDTGEYLCQTHESTSGPLENVTISCEESDDACKDIMRTFCGQTCATPLRQKGKRLAPTHSRGTINQLLHS